MTAFPIELRFHGDVSEEDVLEALYADQSGVEVALDSTVRSGTGLMVFGVVIAAAQLGAALWQIKQASIARREARAAAREAKRAAKRPLRIELHVNGTDHALPMESHEAFVEAVEKAIRGQ